VSLFRGESTPEEIRQRFDHDVERFSNLETGQTAAIDAPLALELVAQAAAAINPAPKRILDLGCGAGNFTLRLLRSVQSVQEIVLLDLSRPMLDRAAERILATCPAAVQTRQGDLRETRFEADGPFDVIVAGAVLHHLRGDDQWQETFSRIFQATAPGGSFWIFDLVTHHHPAIESLMWNRYGEYLAQLKDAEYRDKVFAYATQEDSPRSLPYQLQLLRSAGFSDVEVLHSNACFAAFGGIKGSKGG
jgi:tRNA (cmo5U34)-methyltransferase